MRIIARSTLRQFWEKHPDAEQPLKAWYDEASRAEWNSPTDIKSTYRNTSIIGNNRVVFNIKGNDYRLVTAIDYRRKTVFIKWLGPHSQYDKIDVRTVRYGDQTYQKR